MAHHDAGRIGFRLRCAQETGGAARSRTCEAGGDDPARGVEAVERRVSATDQELVARCRAGERDAFGGLVERYQQRLVRYVRGLGGNEEDARDVAQEAFVRAYTHLARFDSSRPFPVWLDGIASHVAVDWLRRRARRANLDQRVPEPEAPPSPEEEALRGDLAG